MDDANRTAPVAPNPESDTTSPPNAPARTSRVVRDRRAIFSIAMLMAVGGSGAGFLAAVFGSVFALSARGQWAPWRQARLNTLGTIADPILIALSVVSGAAFILWQHAAMRRLVETRPLDSALPSMSVVWWFVPFANLVIPYRQVRALYQAFAQARSRLPAVWWASFLTMSFARRYADKSQESIPSIIGLTLTLVAAVFAIRMVLDIQQGIEGRAPAPMTGYSGSTTAWLNAVLAAPVRSIFVVALTFGAATAAPLVAFGPEVDPGPHSRNGVLSFVDEWVSVSGLRWTFARQTGGEAAGAYDLRVETVARLAKNAPEGIHGIPILVEYELIDEHGARLDSLSERFTLPPDKSELHVPEATRLPLDQAKLVRDVRVSVALDESRIRDCKLGFRPCPQGFVCEPGGGCGLDERDDDVAALEVQGRKTCVDAGRTAGAECLAAMNAHFQEGWERPARYFSNIVCSLMGQDRE